MSEDANLSFEWKGLPCFGNRDLLGLRKVVLLNSSQGKQPTGSDSWIRGTLRAIKDFASKDSVLLTSVGLNTWELTCWAAGNRNLSQIVAVPDDGIRTHDDIYREISRDFALDEGAYCLILLPSQLGKPKSFWENRDRKLVELSDVLVPISIREGGRMDSILKTGGLLAKVEEGYRVEWSPPRDHVHSLLLPKEVIREEQDPRFEGYLTHWTRSSDGPWPGEKRADYYKDVVASDHEYPRSGKRTWERIQREKRIRASSWRIRGGHSVVSFTSLLPSQAVQLMRWRKRYSRYTVEPYGISVEEEAARRMGTSPVRYVSKQATHPLVPEYLLQGKSAKANWPIEHEHRHLGDFDLSELPDASWDAVDLLSSQGLG